jgi:hypothetical protein
MGDYVSCPECWSSNVVLLKDGFTHSIYHCNVCDVDFKQYSTPRKDNKMSNLNINTNCTIVNCICGSEPVCEITSTSPMYVKYKSVQTVSCPHCCNKVSGHNGIKMWNALMRVLVRNQRQNVINKRVRSEKND